MDFNKLPTDNRAYDTLKSILKFYIDEISKCGTIKELIKIISSKLPYNLAYITELKLKVYSRTHKSFELQKIYVLQLVEELVEEEICTNLLYIVEENRRIYYYTRENVINWFNSHDSYKTYFNNPSDEIITIESMYENKLYIFTHNLTNDELIGICYGLNGIPSHELQLKSSVTNNKNIVIENIVEHSLVYRVEIQLATERLKRPYQIDVIQKDKQWLTLYFKDSEFMKGIITVSRWFNLPDMGKNVLWKNLCQYTNNGLIPLNIK